MSIVPRTTVEADPATCAMMAIMEGAQAQDNRMTRLVQEVSDQTDLLLRLQEHSHMQTAQITALTTQMHELQARLEASEIANREKNSALAEKIKALLSRNFPACWDPSSSAHEHRNGFLFFIETGRVAPIGTWGLNNGFRYVWGRAIPEEIYEQMMSLLKEKE